jgi:glucokinase
MDSENGLEGVWQMAKHILGIEIGGTKQQLALGTPEGEILAKRQGRVPLDAGAEGIRRWLLESIPPFLAEGEQRFGPVGAIGCGFGGPINTAGGRVLKSIQVKGWSDFPIRVWLEEHFQRPSSVANDSNAAAWGEYRRGFGRGVQQFFYTNMGSGVGGGLVLDGRLFDGQGFGAAEFGQTYVPDWTAASPGQPEKIENLCSGWAIESRLRTPGYIPETSLLFSRFKENLTAVRASDLAEAARTGDDFALHEIDRIAFSMGLGIANVLSLTGVARVSIGGGVSKMGDLLIEPIRTYAERFEFISSVGHYEIRRCELGEDIVLVGAILIAAGAFGLLPEDQ